MTTFFNFVLFTALVVAVLTGILKLTRDAGPSTAMFLLLTVRDNINPVSSFYDTGIWQANHDGSDLKMVFDDTLIQEQSPTWSSDLQYIYYTNIDSLRFVGRYDRRTGEQVLLTNSVRSIQPRPSPDGKWILYINDEFGIARLTLMRSDGTESRLLTSTNTNEGQAYWSANSQYILFVQTQATTSTIHEFDLQSNQSTQLREGISPIYTADEQHIVFLQFEGERVQMMQVPRDNPNAEPILLYEDTRIDLPLTPSPDGKWITFASRGSILQVPTDGSGDVEVLLLGEPRREYSFPAWSPLFDLTENWGGVFVGSLLIAAATLLASLGWQQFATSAHTTPR